MKIEHDMIDPGPEISANPDRLSCPCQLPKWALILRWPVARHGLRWWIRLTRAVRGLLDHF